jgi:hypothetical protein
VGKIGRSGSVCVGPARRARPAPLRYPNIVGWGGLERPCTRRSGLSRRSGRLLMLRLGLLILHLLRRRRHGKGHGRDRESSKRIRRLVHVRHSLPTRMSTRLFVAKNMMHG